MSLESSRKGIKVTDKRMFTAEGEVRDDYEGPADDGPSKEDPRPAGGDPGPTSTREEPAAPRGTETSEDETPTLFMALADNLIVNAYATLGMVPMPDGSRPEPDFAATRQMISLLEMLEEKTKGNLDSKEENYLTTHLGELKLAFVRASKSI